MRQRDLKFTFVVGEGNLAFDVVEFELEEALCEPFRPLRQEISFRSSGNAFAFYFRDRNAQGAQLLEDVHEFAVALDLAVFKFEGMQEVVFVITFGISGEKNLAVTVAFDPEMIGVVGSEYIYVVPLPIGKALQ